VTRFIKALFMQALFTPYYGSIHTYSQVVLQLVSKIRSLEFFASRKSRGVEKERRQHQDRIQHQGALPEHTHAAPRRNAESIEAGWRGTVSIEAGASLSLATMLAAGSTAEQSLDRHTMALAQYALMFLLLFFHAISVAAAQV
jgi:hypothetical protein